jgi:beta-galactosidase
MILGCAWYPEHWDESRWPEDIRLMREAGITLVRVGEFAWSRLEPADGQFALDWLERAVALAAEQGMMIVLGTPTAAPPAWLTAAHPEVVAIREDGLPVAHGGRCHFNPASAVYRDYCARIASAMAERFGTHPQVIGWQIDNEYNHMSYDAETTAQWQAWLQAKYGTLDALNSHWTTSYWSQEYFDWTQVPLPLRAGHNPALLLDWKRFGTDLYRSYQKVQIEAIRAHAESRQWITHNFMGWFDLFDHYTMSEDLEIASWDNYVGTGHLNYLDNGAMHDLTRGFKRRNFLLLETQPGSVNWSGVNNVLDRGEVRCMAWHAVGHGAEVVSYWQWRSALNGQEQYHGCLVAPDGNPRPLYEEVSKIGKEFASVAKALRGTTPASEVAILHSYDDRWAINLQRHHKDFDPVQHLLSFYRPLRSMSYGIDILHPSAPLSAFKLVIAPHLHTVDDETCEHLLKYVEDGGHLVLGPRSGFKNAFDNALIPARQPGPLAWSLGAHVEEYYALDTPVPVTGAWEDGEGSLWAEWLKVDADNVEVKLRYGACNGWLDEQPAMVTRKVGNGRLTYLATWLNPALMRRVLTWMLQASRLTPPFGPVPEGVEVCRRVGAGKELYLLINHTARPLQVELPRALQNALTRQVHQANIWLPARDVAVMGARVEIATPA